MFLKVFLLILVVWSYVNGSRLSNRSSQCELDGGQCVRAQQCQGVINYALSGCSRNRFCCKTSADTGDQTDSGSGTNVAAGTGDATCGIITGVTTPNPLLRIVGGDPALEGQWPWQVSLYGTTDSHFCGGTLITPDWIVTAAHCVDRQVMEEITVVLGEHHHLQLSGNEVKLSLAEMIMHPDYVSGPGSPNDIAIIRLSQAADIGGNFVRTACLPTITDTFDATSKCYITGWGYTRNTGDSQELQHLQISITNETTCKQAWGDDIITDKQVCVGNGDVGACQGDSGGPLVCLKDDHYVLVGATSWGHFTCDTSGYPDVFTRIASYLDWIHQHIGTQ